MGINISEIVQGSRYKNFMKYLYGWGASVVLAGALFKLQHWPGAGVMLTVGMTVEAFIFFFSAFEPVVEEVDWSLVYPELAGITDGMVRGTGRGGNMDPVMLEGVIASAIAKSPLASGVSVKVDAVAPVSAAPVATSASAPTPTPQPVASGGRGSAAAFVFTEKFNEMLEKAQIGPELFARVGAGLGKLADASTGIAQISAAVSATEKFSTNLQRAGEAVGGFAESYEESASLLSRAAQVVSASMDSTSKQIDEAAKGATSAVKDALGKMSSQLNSVGESVGSGIQATRTHIDLFNKSIDSLNAAYELQIKEVQSRMSQSSALGKGVEDMIAQLQATLADTQRYGQSVATLTDNVSQLNAVYGNMLSAMGSIIGARK